METPKPPTNTSPRWSANSKLIVGLTLVAILAVLLQQFNEIVGPLLLSFVLAFLLHPIATQFNKRLKIPWRLSVVFVFLILIIILAGLFTLVGFAIVQQIQNLIATVQRFITELPQLVSTLSSQVFQIGPFELDLARFDLTNLANRLFSFLQAILGQAGSLVGTIATGTISTFGLGVFILLIAFFLLTEGGQVRENILHIDIPGYDHEIRRLGRELTRIWDAYLRSQFLIVVLVVISYYILMTFLGMRFALGIAIMAGIARLVPYIGPFFVWTTAALLAYFSPSNYFGLQPWAYTVLVIGLSLLLDWLFDQYIQPKLMGRSLGIHPAAILVAAIIAYQWLGIIGLVLAAPVLATVTLLFRYSLRKMFDLDPWPQVENEKPIKLPHDRLINRLRARWRIWLRR
jgi:predicted PurR-regulated permease PerM